MNTISDMYVTAVKLSRENKFNEATEILAKIRDEAGYAPYCDFQLAVMANMQCNPVLAYDLFYQSFNAAPGIMSVLYDENHPNYNYIFQGINPEVSRTDCPLCGEQGKPHWTYILCETSGFNPEINPVRMWMYCKPCHHIFARDFPEKIFMYNANPRKANPQFFSYYSNVLTNIKKYTSGMSLFEVGVGASECLLAAREMGYKTLGIDVISRHVDDAVNLYGLDAETSDFIEFESTQKWDIIIMGDVLEHVSDPVLAIKKVKTLLNPGGAVWISTPNFDSAHSVLRGHNDAMRKQHYHLNYFSRESLYRVLEKHGLTPVDYQISNHYNGSMEVIAVAK